MKARLSRLRMRDLAMFALIAAAVTAAVVLIGRELDVGRQAAATREGVTTNSEPSASSETTVAQQRTGGDLANATTELSLTLTGATTCETGHPHSAYGHHLTKNADGSNRWIDLIAWQDVAETPIGWSVSGGTSPFRLEIDDETRDAHQSYTGASGRASVSCALRTGETVISGPPEDRYRRYLSEPTVDSGWKTVRATVTDATGATVMASVDIYVILAVEGSGNVLSDGTYEPYRFKAGRTYRVNGFLMTFPADAIAGAWDSAEGGEDAFTIAFQADGYRGVIYIGGDTGRELGRYVEEFPTPGVAGAARSVSEAELNARMDALIESVGEPPPGSE